MLALVTDTSCGLTRAEAAELGVDVVPMAYVTDGVRHQEGMVGENGDYDALLRSSRIAVTEAVRTSAFERVFDQHLAAGRDVLCLTISARLSGTYRSAREAAAASNAKLEVGGKGSARAAAMDSLCAAGGLEFVVRRACALAAKGLSLDEVIERLRDVCRRQEVVFTVPDLTPLRKSGRLGAIRRSVATRINSYPIMKLEEGGIRDLRTVRGAAAAGRALAELAPAGTREFLISHFGERGIEAQQVFLAVRRMFPQASVRVKDGGPVLANNLGLGSVALAWEPVEA